MPARVANPLAADASLLRSNGLVSMAHALAWNLNRGQRNVRLFEIGRAYGMKDGAPVETRIVTHRRHGRWRAKKVWPNRRGEYEFADLKGDLDQIGELAGGFAWSAPIHELPGRTCRARANFTCAERRNDRRTTSLRHDSGSR